VVAFRPGDQRRPASEAERFPHRAPGELGYSYEPSVPPERGTPGGYSPGVDTAGRLTGVAPGGVITLTCLTSTSSRSCARPRTSSRIVPVSASEFAWTLKTTVASNFIWPSE
jgi:hypothetical protein